MIVEEVTISGGIKFAIDENEGKRALYREGKMLCEDLHKIARFVYFKTCFGARYMDNDGNELLKLIFPTKFDFKLVEDMMFRDIKK